MPMGPGLSLGLSQPVRAAGGGLGPEKVVNGSFATASDWVCDGADLPLPSIGAGVLSFNGGPGGNAANSGTVDTHTVYRTVFTVVSISTGPVQIQVGDGQTVERTTAGTFTEDINSGGFTDIIVISGDVTDAVIDNVSVKQVL